MLNELLIKHFAIIDKLSLSLDNGLNIISGETGAGKSIIVNAVNLLLGGRAQGDLIRSGQEEASVEARFNITGNKDLQKLLQENGYENDELIIRRSISKHGKNKIYINGSMATLSILQTLSKGLIEIASQHEHQTLQNPENHIIMLDSFGKNHEALKRYQNEYKTFKSLEEERNKIFSSHKNQAAKRDFLTFQINEIEEANVLVGEDKKLEEKREILLNRQKIRECATESYKAIYEEEPSILKNIASVKTKLASLAEIDKSTKQNLEQAEHIYFELEDLSLNLRSYLSSIDDVDENIDDIEDRIHVINHLKKKYGKEISDINTALEGFKAELDIYENYEDKLNELDEKLSSSRKRVEQYAKTLSSERRKAANILQRELHSELKELAMERTKVFVDIKPIEEEFTEFGADKVQFLCSTNVGEDLKPLNKIASGGELSRFMLAFKKIITSKEDVNIYIFDEVDSGISGAQAEIVGKKIKAVSKDSQVLCITHLPQIASQADKHLKVEKCVEKGRTVVTVKPLNKEQRIKEISRMLGGVKVTKSAIEHAKTLIDASI